MDDQTPLVDPGGTTTATETTTPLPPHDPPPIGPRRLTRSVDDRMIAGVCGGVARYLGVDPTLVRVGTALLTLAGGIGIAAYLVAWLLLPEEGEADPHWRPWQIIAVVASVCLLTGWADLWDSDTTTVAIALLGLGSLLVWGGGGASTRSSAAGAGAGVDIAPPPPPDPATREPVVPVVEHTSPGRWSWSPPPTVPPPGPPVATPAAARPSSGRRFAATFAAVVGGLLVAASAISAALFFSRHVSPTVILGLSLAGFGVALVVGAWFGGLRALVPGALTVLFGLAAVAVIDVPFTGGTGDPEVRPATAADIPSVERLAIGQLTIDLTSPGLDLSGQEEQRIEASVAVGELVVEVPRGVTVEVHADAGLGQLDVLGVTDEGPSPEIDRVFEGAGSGRIELDLEVGIGHVEVRRG